MIPITRENWKKKLFFSTWRSQFRLWDMNLHRTILDLAKTNNFAKDRVPISLTVQKLSGFKVLILTKKSNIVQRIIR